jgi:outer membrane protein assembly factor BamB/tRNA A-37 threonylcarbamoyl transferase component Bud32
VDTQNITQSFNPNSGKTSQLNSGTILVDRYLIQEVIGVGGMGAVYRARDLHFPNVVKLVAVKEMINQARDSLVRQTIVQNFEREAHILVTLAHPSIPKIFDFFTHETRSYLVLEFVNGRDLEAYLHETQEFIPEDQAVGWAIELCDVLMYLHNHKPESIIFRDMKPSNIMVNQDNHIILVDFGIAKLFKEGQKGTMIGTEGYSPPEQYRGEATQRADIYSLGATLHHLLTRRDPRLEAPFTFLERPIRKINPAVSVELETVVNTALQYNPADRYPSAEAMKDALIMAAKRTGVLSRISVSAIAPTQEQTVKPLWTFKCEDEIRGSPALDNNVIYIGSYDNNMYAINASNGEFIWKYPTDGGVVNRPVITEGSVYFGSEDNRLYCVSSRSGKLNWTYQTEGPIRCSPRVAEGHVFFGSDDNHLYAVNLISGRMTWKTETSGPVRSSPFVTSDYIYFGTEYGEVLCVDFRGQVKWRFQTKRGVTSSPLVEQGVIFFASLDGTFYAMDAKSGWSLWRFRMGKGSISSPSKFTNYVYVGSADGNIYCLDANTAKEVWHFKTEHQVSGSPVVYKDSVFCGSADGSLYCLEFRTGRLKWKFATGGPITGTPVINNDIIYIGSHDRILYALLT